ncbi:phage holin family protein [Chondromyces crocatus]|uniref:Phage holin family protein n=1 Tax=Chondromyces crocatus TaxID=52 RepID=A0A0K1E7E2_CHOCO|nr:phage holin family protein [Chondromyces crocatus]AKT36779.1 uncharacterized protein CMC5_009000 [Chondromyces crocatus]
MQHVEPGPSTPTVDLLKEAILDTRELVQTEIALAKEEVRGEIQRAKMAGIALGAALCAAIIGVTMLFVALALAIQLSALPALLIGVVLLVVAALAMLLGYKAIPLKPLPRTRARVEEDLRTLKEHLA